MAIEFPCPYCSVTIRVPENAGGRAGRCPKCTRRLTVPKATAKPATAMVDLAPQVDFSALAQPQIVVSDDPGGSPAGIESVAVTADGSVPAAGSAAISATAPATVPSIAAARIRRRSRGMGAWILPISVVVVAAGGALAAYLFLAPERPLPGKWTAVRVEPGFLQPALVPATLAKTDANITRQILDRLEVSPVSLASEDLKLVFSAEPIRGVTVAIGELPGTEIYRVSWNEAADVRAVLEGRLLGLDATRDNDWKAAAEGFYNAMAHVLKDRSATSGLAGYRDPLGLASLVGGVGYHVVAIAKGRTVRPVFEDRDHNLYFMLPAGLKEFRVEGRKFGRRAILPLQIAVTVLTDQPPVAAPIRREGGGGPGGKPGDADKKKKPAKEAPGLGEGVDADEDKPASESKDGGKNRDADEDLSDDGEMQKKPAAGNQPSKK